MKIRVAYTVTVDENFRRALACRYGGHGKIATREDVKQLNEMYGSSTDADLLDDWRACEECGTAKGGAK